MRRPYGTHPKRCSCGRCQVALSAYRKRRRVLLGTGRPTTDLVDAAPVREHALQLQAANISCRKIAELAGVNVAFVDALIYGRCQSGTGHRKPVRRVRAASAQAVLAVECDPAAGYLVPAVGTVRRLQALAVIGYSGNRLAKLLHKSPKRVHKLLSGDGAGQVTARLDSAARALFDQLWNRPPVAVDSDTRRSITEAINHAAARNWAPPMAWDEGALDDPNARPHGIRRAPAGGPDRATRAAIHAAIHAAATQPGTASGERAAC